MEHLDFARVAKRDFGIDAIECVNVFFMDKARDRTYLSEMKSRADGEGVEELMPYAKAVSAKSHDFDASGNEIRTDYERMVRIVLDAGYSGYIGIEYEGNEASERDGVGLTKALLTRVRETLSREMAAV